jgi:hypothetical protein
MIAGWTGHRPELFRDPDAARARVDAAARELVTVKAADGLRFFVGGQRGVDTWAALSAVALGVPFQLILPLAPATFAAGWTEDDRLILDQTIARAAELRIAGGYTERNRQIARGVDLLIAVWTGVRGGGTAETIALAEAAGTPIQEILLDPAPSAGAAQGRGI